MLLVFLLCLHSPQSERNQSDLLDYNMGSSKSVDLEDQFGESVDFVEITFFPSTVCPLGPSVVPTEELLSGNPSFLALRWIPYSGPWFQLLSICVVTDEIVVLLRNPQMLYCEESLSLVTWQWPLVIL